MTTEAYNDIRVYLLVALAAIMGALGLWLLVRGAKERPLWRPIPGRIVLGTFLVLYAANDIDRAQARFRHIGSTALADAESVSLVVAAVLCGIWTIVRFWRGDMEHHDPARGRAP